MAEMTLERAREIVGACVQNGVFLHLGARSGEVPSLASMTLADMVEANRLVQASNRESNTPDGVRRRIQTVCDDRLLAALYVAHHFPGSAPDECEPICLLPDGRAVFVVRVPVPVDREEVSRG